MFCGMNSNVSDYLLATSDHPYDVIALTETWLNECTTSSLLFGSEYEVFRTDRNYLNSRKTIGGGVLIAVHRNIAARSINEPSWDVLEQVWISIKLSNHTLYLCTVYFPPDRTRDESLINTHVQSLSAIISKAHPCDEVIIIGDFNLPGLFWSQSGYGFVHPNPDRSSIHSCAMNLLDSYSAATLQQINTNINENGRILDLCFVNSRDVAPSLLAATSPLVKVVAHHPALTLTLEDCIERKMRRANVCIQRNFKRADYVGLQLALHDWNWNRLLDHVDVDTAANEFTSIICGLIELFVPKTRFVSRSNCPWKTVHLRNAKKNEK